MIYVWPLIGLYRRVSKSGSGRILHPRVLNFHPSYRPYLYTQWTGSQHRWYRCEADSVIGQFSQWPEGWRLRRTYNCGIPLRSANTRLMASIYRAGKHHHRVVCQHICHTEQYSTVIIQWRTEKQHNASHPQMLGGWGTASRTLRSRAVSSVHTPWGGAVIAPDGTRRYKIRNTGLARALCILYSAGKVRGKGAQTFPMDTHRKDDQRTGSPWHTCIKHSIHTARCYTVLMAGTIIRGGHQPHN
jgi:hypothetical protein